VIDPTPPADPAPADRERLRRGWGIDNDTPVVALLSDPAPVADAWTAALVVSLVRTASGRRVRLLVHPLQHRRARAQDHLDRGPDADLFVQDARLAHPESVLAGCDALLFVNPRAGTAARPDSAAARHAVAAGLPVAAPDTPAHRAALADSTAPVGFAPRGQPKKLADRLLHTALRLPGLGRHFVPPDVAGMTPVS